MDDLAFRPATELARLIAQGEVTSKQLVELYLERIDRLNGDLNAVVTVDADPPTPLAGPLHGVPMTVKDCFETAGMRTTAGSEDYADHVPERDATVVQRLREAGAVIIGKTNLPEEATGQETANTLFGRTVNPWDLDRTPGGSSGGAATALAAGLTGLEFGSDSGGSIRQPAHFCGVYGHVPTHGVVPPRGHLPSIPGDELNDYHKDLMVVGPMARSAQDLDVALSVVADPDVDLPPAPNRPLRVAAWLDDETCPVDDSIAKNLHDAAHALDAVDAKPDFDLADAKEIAWALWVAGMDTEVAHRMTHDEWLAADEERRNLERTWDAFFEQYDVVLLPITPTAALHHDPNPDKVDSVDYRLKRTIEVNGKPRPYLDQIVWNIVVGMARLPSTAAPAGLTDDGLPVGLQIVGPRFGDRTTIAAAETLATRIGGFTPPPHWV